jgi:hypothetical protein
MEGHSEVRQALFEIVGEEGCGLSCSEADVFFDEEGWKLMLCGFMEPWKLGLTVEEAKTTLKELGSMAYGLS